MDRRLFLGSGVAGIGGLLVPQQSVGRSIGSSFERPILEGLLDVEMAELLILKDVPQPKYLRVFWRFGNKRFDIGSDRFGIEIIPRREIRGQYSTWTIDGTKLLNVDRVPIYKDGKIWGDVGSVWVRDKIYHRELIDIRSLTLIKLSGELVVNTYRRIETATGACWFIVPEDAFKT